MKLLRFFPFFKIKKRTQEKDLKKLKEVFGIWKNRNISKLSLRKKVWRV